jgi:hypothetical protein
MQWAVPHTVWGQNLHSHMHDLDFPDMEQATEWVSCWRENFQLNSACESCHCHKQNWSTVQEKFNERSWSKDMQWIRLSGFDSRRALGIFLFTIASGTVLGPTQPPIQWIPGALSLEVKRPGREADHSPPSSAEVKNAWGYTSIPPVLLHGVVPS